MVALRGHELEQKVAGIKKGEEGGCFCGCYCYCGYGCSDRSGSTAECAEGAETTPSSWRHV